MPKMKSRAGVRKRIKLTAKGKVKYKHQNTRHILTKKTPKRKRQLRGLDVLDPMEEKRVKDMMAM